MHGGIIHGSLVFAFGVSSIALVFFFFLLSLRFQTNIKTFKGRLLFAGMEEPKTIWVCNDALLSHTSYKRLIQIYSRRKILKEGITT